ncbi:DUF2227 family putative metal-binding protein (plasmid) [Deinococcus radiomollis]|uniref:DUF2227 family putative metal-binding protein n=1 Tax=Deinococcus radiomollis TaxID=468916 RepID=UPI0038924538
MHGYQHTAVNMAALVPVAGVGFWMNHPELVAAFGAGFVFGTLLVTPDLDLHFNDARRRWGGLKFIWAPYVALSKHRGMSHSYVLGPLIRLLYLAVLVVPLVALALHLVGPVHVAVPLWVFLLAFAGYVVSQWLHLLCDRIQPDVRLVRSVRRRPRRP